MKTAIRPLVSRIDLKPVASACAVAAAAILVLGGGATPSHAEPATGFIQSGAGPWAFNDPANWLGGNVNGIWDAGLTLEATQTVEFSADTVLSGPLQFSYAGVFSETLRGKDGDRTLTLGGGIIVDMAASGRTLTIGSSSPDQRLNVDLGGAVQSLQVTSGRTLIFHNVLSNGGIVASGGTINFSGVNTYTGTTTLNAGRLELNTSSASIANSDVTVNGGTFAANNSNSTLTRAKSVTLSGISVFSVTGVSSGDSVDRITNGITANSGAAGIVSVSANAARNAQITASSFVRNPGGTVLFRGTNLGVNSIASATAGAANISFDAAPALSGSGAAGTSTVGIIVGAYGDTVANGTGFGATGGLVTYDAANGVRLLDRATEYKSTITDGQSQLDNVRLEGPAGTPLTLNLAAPVTTVHSLSISVASAGSGVTLSGDSGAALKVSSGVIYGSQTVSGPTANEKMLISVPTLDLNGQEGGIITSNTAQTSPNGVHNAPLEIQSVITNDNGKGVTKAGPGSLRIAGDQQSTYTGDTVVNEGILYLGKTVSNIALPEGNTLVLNGGILLQQNNQIPDTANVTVNGGSWAISSSTSNGNNSFETINNLLMTGGSAKNGQSKGGSFNILGTATFTGGSFSGVGDGSNIIVSGKMSISNGATFSLGASGSNTVFNSRLTLNGGLDITNTDTGAYTPITLSSSGTTGRRGARLILGSDVTFTGNAQNSETVTISAPENNGLTATIALNGIPVWNVGDGAAAEDLTVEPGLTDFDSTIGSFVKTGAGSLVLAGTSTYTGTTEVRAGMLVVRGAISGTSLFEVSAGATLATGVTGTIATGPEGHLSIAGTLSPGGNGSAGELTLDLGIDSKLDFAPNSTLRLDLGDTSDLISFASAGDWLGGSGKVTLSLSGTINYAATYTLFENVTTAGFTFAAITGYDSAEYSAQVGQSGTDYTLSFVPVPEPSAAVSLIGGLGLLAGFRRSRRK